MAFTKITPADTTGKGVIGLPDTPELSSTDMQEKFDELALDVIVPKFNNLVDEITDAFVEEGGDIADVAQALTDEVSRAQGAEGDLSDAITTLDGAVMKKATYDSDNDGVVDNSELLNGHADSYFATAQSVSDLTTTVNGKMTRSVYDADNDGVVDNAEALGGHGASYFATASALSDEISRAQAAEGGKVDKVAGKGLSTNDFTTAYKNQIDTNTSNIGNLSNLTTTAKDNLVAAINEAAQSGGGASDLDDLNDVNLTNLADGQVLKYNATSSKWENGAGGGGGASTLSDLTDTAIATPSAGQALVYSSVGKWTNVTLPSATDKMNIDGSNSALNVVLSNNLIVNKEYNSFTQTSCAISKAAGSNQPIVFTTQYVYINYGIMSLFSSLIGITDAVYIIINDTIMFLNVNSVGSDRKTITAYLVDDVTDAIEVATSSVTFYIRNVTKGSAEVVYGLCNVADGDGSSSSGYCTVASGNYSRSEGIETEASGNVSHAEGSGTKAIGVASHAEGFSDVQAVGDGSHAEGSSTTASGNYSHAECYNNKANANYSHAEGSGTTAGGEASHTEGSGCKTKASGSSATGAHAEGYSTQANADYAHSEGYRTKANGQASHAEGNNVIAAYNYQHVQGQYNDNKSTTLFEIGNGTSANRKNIFEIYDDGYMSFDNGVNKIKFGVDANGRYGYIKAGADTVYPFKNEITVDTITPTRNASNTTLSFTYTDRPAYFAIIGTNSIYACWSFISFEWGEILDAWTNKKAVWHVRTTSSSTKSLRDDYSSYISVSEDTNNKTITVTSSSTSYKFNATDYIVQAVAST